MSRRALSVIIPALDEACHLETLLADLLARGEEGEIILVDGGSTDGHPRKGRRPSLL
jgi:glycosyltransferase involved in cell wall biosynthesis